jgi:hypothetical protein
MDVLRRLPYLAAAPEALLLWLRAYGELRSYQPAQCIIPRRVMICSDGRRLEGQAGLMVLRKSSVLYPQLRASVLDTPAQRKFMCSRML